MNRKRWVAAGIAASMLWAGTAAAESGVRVEKRATVQNIRSASTPAPARRVVAFETEKTDSWLCNYVSVFFCSDLIPPLNTGSSTTNNAASRVPDRSRQPGQ